MYKSAKCESGPAQCSVPQLPRMGVGYLTISTYELLRRRCSYGVIMVKEAEACSTEHYATTLQTNLLCKYSVTVDGACASISFFRFGYTYISDVYRIYSFTIISIDYTTCYSCRDTLRGNTSYKSSILFYSCRGWVYQCSKQWHSEADDLLHFAIRYNSICSVMQYNGTDSLRRET